MRRQCPRASKGAETLQLHSPSPGARAGRSQREARPSHVGVGGTDGRGVPLAQALQGSQSGPLRQADTYLGRNVQARLTRKAILCKSDLGERGRGELVSSSQSVGRT